MTERPNLRLLSSRMGILPSYVDWRAEERPTSDATREAILRAMGLDAPDEAAAARALADLDRRDAGSPLDPLRVVRADAPALRRLPVRLPPEARGDIRWELRVDREDGGSGTSEGQAPLPSGGTALLSLPPLPLPPGYHRVRLSIDAPGGERSAEQTLAVAPASCFPPQERIGDRRAFGLLANLYALRRRGDWGVGDLGALRELVAWASGIGAAFAGISPLHATRNREPDVSPYLPVSRLFRNPIYLDVAAVPEAREAPAAARPDAAALRRCRAARRVRYADVWRLKREALRALHREFAARHRGRDTGRGRAYAAFRESQGELLDLYATFCALEEHHGGRWPSWPAEHRDPGSAAVRAFREAHPGEIDLHRWMQFEVDRQLAAAAAAAPLPLGIFHDLALGSAADGFDAWAFADLFVSGASVGAPPDGYSETGQNWALPPLHPLRLREDGYRFWIRLLRAATDHAGMLRLDHVMGLARQFWIPAGATGAAGAYVRYPADDLLGLLALESRRHGCVVVGEDLGTVPPGFGDLLARWGVLSTRVLYFERDLDGSFRPPSAYPERSLATANTHDLPTLAGFWTGRDLDLRRAAGQIADETALAAARSGRAADREALRARLSAEGLLESSAPDTTAARAEAVHAFLSRTPARLIGVAVDDLAGEDEAVNLAGIDNLKHPSWSRRARPRIEALAADPEARRALSGLAARRMPPAAAGPEDAQGAGSDRRDRPRRG
jgi:4-alpha-glucanotransferase